MKKILLINVILFILMFSYVYAQEQSLGTFKANSCIDLIQTCATCTYVNFTTVSLPNSNQIIINSAAYKNGYVFSYNFCNTSQSGLYLVNGIGDIDGVNTIFTYTFEVNQSGQGFNNVLYEYLLFAAMTIILYIILFMAFKNYDKNMAMISSFGILALGIYTFINGIANLNNQYTNAFSIINIGLGAYVLIRSAIELIQEEWDGTSQEG